MLTIRAMTEADADEVAAVSLSAYGTAGHFDANGAYARTVADVLGRVGHGELLVAEDAGAIVGAVMLCHPDSALAEVSRPGEMEFRFLAVEPTQWRRGIGEALVLTCHRRARELGAHTMVICVIDANLAAHRFYERPGYTRFPERDWQPHPGVMLLGFSSPLT